MDITIIEQREVLEKYHKGLAPFEISVILHNLNNKRSIYLETLEDGQTVKNWYFYPNKGGQLMSGTNFETFKNNNYECEN